MTLGAADVGQWVPPAVPQVPQESRDFPEVQVLAQEVVAIIASLQQLCHSAVLVDFPEILPGCAVVGIQPWVLGMGFGGAAGWS